jgi:hypothetical protein
MNFFDENAKRKGSMICIKDFFEKIPKKSSFLKKEKRKKKFDILNSQNRCCLHY